MRKKTAMLSGGVAGNSQPGAMPVQGPISGTTPAPFQWPRTGLPTMAQAAAANPNPVSQLSPSAPVPATTQGVQQALAKVSAENYQSCKGVREMERHVQAAREAVQKMAGIVSENGVKLSADEGNGICGVRSGDSLENTPWKFAESKILQAFKQASLSRSATGDSQLRFSNHSDDYAQGQNAWASLDRFMKTPAKGATTPNPFKGNHNGSEKKANWGFASLPQAAQDAYAREVAAGRTQMTPEQAYSYWNHFYAGTPRAQGPFLPAQENNPGMGQLPRWAQAAYRNEYTSGRTQATPEQALAYWNKHYAGTPRAAGPEAAAASSNALAGLPQWAQQAYQNEVNAGRTRATPEQALAYWNKHYAGTPRAAGPQTANQAPASSPSGALTPQNLGMQAGGQQLRMQKVTPEQLAQMRSQWSRSAPAGKPMDAGLSAGRKPMGGLISGNLPATPGRRPPTMPGAPAGVKQMGPVGAGMKQMGPAGGMGPRQGSPAPRMKFSSDIPNFAASKDREGLQRFLEEQAESARAIREQRADEAIRNSVNSLSGPMAYGAAPALSGSLMAVPGAMIGTGLGSVAGAMRGDIGEGASRGMARGAATGLGAGAISALAQAAAMRHGAPMGATRLLGQLGALTGGGAGYYLSGKALGKPKAQRKGEADKKAGGEQELQYDLMGKTAQLDPIPNFAASKDREGLQRFLEEHVESASLARFVR